MPKKVGEADEIWAEVSKDDCHMPKKPARLKIFGRNQLIIMSSAQKRGCGRKSWAWQDKNDVICPKLRHKPRSLDISWYRRS